MSFGRCACLIATRDAGGWLSAELPTLLMTGIPIKARADDASRATSARRRLSQRRCCFSAEPTIRPTRKAREASVFIEDSFVCEMGPHYENTRQFQQISLKKLNSRALPKILRQKERAGP